MLAGNDLSLNEVAFGLVRWHLDVVFRERKGEFCRRVAFTDLENRPEDFFEGGVRDRKLRRGGGAVILNLSNLAGQNNKQLHE